MQTEKLNSPDTMAPATMAALVDAALRSPHSLLFLDTVVRTFKMLGRNEDAAAVAWIAYLYDRGEVEALLSLRAAWRQGLARNPAETARRVGAPHG